MHYLVAAYLEYEPPSERPPAQSLDSVLAAQPIREGAPRMDDSAWATAMNRDSNGC